MLNKYIVLVLSCLFISFNLHSQEVSKAPRPTLPNPVAGPDNVSLSSLKTLIAELICTVQECCQDLREIECDPILIHQSDIGITGFVINTPGVYFLAENIAFAPLFASSAITIASDDVLLDLRCFAIEQINDTPEVNGITVAGTENITIQHGQINNFTGDGILIVEGSRVITCKKITIQSCNRAIALEGAIDNPVRALQILNCDLLESSTSIAWYFSHEGTIKNCNALTISQAGFDIRSSVSNVVQHCSIRQVDSVDSSVYGVFTENGFANIFSDLLIEGLSTQATFSGNTATGFLIGANENNLKLEESQIGNCITTSNAQPFGVQMLYTFTDLSNAGLPDFATNASIRSLAWTSSGRYFAIGGVTDTNGNQVQVFEFVNNSLIPITAFDHGATINSVSWSPDGRYLVIGGDTGTGGFQVRVLEFNQTSLTTIANFTHGATVFAVDWSPNGKYIAIGGLAGAGGFEVRVLEFTGTTLVTQANFAHGAGILTVSWSPNNQFLAIAGGQSGAINIRVLEFTGFSLVQQATQGPFGVIVDSVDWSHNGQFLASTNGDLVQVFLFTGSSLIEQASFDHGNDVNSVNWPPDDAFIVMGGSASDIINQFYVRVLEFTGNALINRAGFNHGNVIFSAQWIPYGSYIGIAGNFAALNQPSIRILSGLQFPHNNIIINNLIHNVNGPTLPAGTPGVSSGRGLSASSGANLIIKNNAFDNDINYVFVTNVFQQFLANVFNTTPSIIDNLSFPPL